MLVNKVFLKKTKRGNILKVLNFLVLQIVREHYLREDIWCGSELCHGCGHEGKEVVLEKDPASISTVVDKPHYLLLDTNIILDQIDLLEEKDFTNVIILQTVLQEVKHRSSSVYNKLREIIGNPSRKFYVFVNEHRKETYVEREKGEIINDRNDRAVRVSAKWYSKHLGGKIDIVLLTDDAGNLAKSKSEGIKAFKVGEYVAGITSNPDLVDKLNRRDFVVEGAAGEPLFPPHLTPLQVQEGVKTGKLLTGSFLASRDNFLEGQVNVEGREQFILVQGRAGLNRAVDGDTVVIELLPENEWKGASQLVLEDEGEGDEAEAAEDAVKKDAEVAEEIRPTARVVAILRRKWRQYCGILQMNTVSGATRHLFVPAERKIPKVRIETRQAETLKNQRIVVAIDSWPRHSRYPLGHFVRSLGPIGDKNTENEVLLLEHDVPHSRFSEAVLACLPTLPWITTDQDVVSRVDLRHIDICSVDPPGCTDIDDALHCRPLPDGNLEVGVHIADVTHFIRPGTAIDREAAHRATTVYLVDRRIDMVPELLSSNLCSLRGNEERFAFSVVWEMSQDARIISTRFHKSVIRSRAALTYEEAQNRIDDASKSDSVTTSLRSLNRLAKILKERRIQNGALVLASPEIRFQVDSETHDPVEVQAKALRDTNSMVEEFMLLANISVAEKIYQEFPECAMLRRHPQPPPANFDPLLKAARTLGFDLNADTGKQLALSLDKAVRQDNAYFNTMLRILATRCMMQAVYFSSGMIKQEEFHHYGLACPIYTHFTSPIRRYADIIVHRLLAVAVSADVTYPDLLDKRKTHELCHNLNYRNRMAQYAGRASVGLNTHLFFRGRVTDEEAYVLSVKKNALQVLIPKYGLEGTLYVSGRSEITVNFVYDEQMHTQKCGDIVFRAFDPLTVQLSLDSSNVQHEKLVFKLVKPFIENFSVPSGSEVTPKATTTTPGSGRKRKANS